MRVTSATMSHTRSGGAAMVTVAVSGAASPELPGASVSVTARTVSGRAGAGRHLTERSGWACTRVADAATIRRPTTRGSL